MIIRYSKINDLNSPLHVNLKVKVIKKIKEIPWTMRYYISKDVIEEQKTRLAEFLVKDESGEGIFRVYGDRINEIPIGEEILIFNAILNFMPMAKVKKIIQLYNSNNDYFGSWKAVSTPPDAVYTP